MDDRVYRRTLILSGHLAAGNPTSIVSSAPCLAFTPPEASGTFDFNVHDMRLLLDGHHVEERDRVFALMKDCHLFNPRKLGSRVFVSPDYNRPMEEQREITMRRIMFLLQKGVFDGWLTRSGPENALKNLAALECLSIFDHSLAIKLGVHFFLWGCAIKYLGTKRHHNKWLEDTEKYKAKGCFSMTELGHGSNVRGIETIATYDLGTSEFIINTPCESAQKYWIGGAANHATHTVVFAQLCINGRNEGVHAFIAQIRDSNGNICPNIRIADCGHKIGLNGVDNGRIWFDNVRVPRENLLNSVADVSPDGQYQSAIKDPVQRFSAFLAPLTLGRVNISASAICQSKVALAIAIRYSLSRRAFSISSNEPETLLLDYPSHQRRLLPILAKTYAMSFASTDLKKIYVNRTAKDTKTIHVYSSAFKSIFTWHNMRTLQECREACGGQGLKTDNRIGQLIGEYDVQSTFEGDNNVLLQQVSKALLAEYFMAKKKESPFKILGLEHMNGPPLVIPETLSPSILRNSQFQTELFCLHERDLLIKFAEEISKSMARGKTLEHALILSHQLAQDLAWAFSERAILQSFLKAEMTAASHLKNVLGLVRTMYVLISMEENASFLRYGHLSVTNAAIVREEVAKLLTELRPHALALVTSFGIPDAYLSPLAFDWIEANSWTSVLAGHQV